MNREIEFYDTYCSEAQYGKYADLICHFISSFRSSDSWTDEILPYLEKLKSKEAVIDDWNSFSWGGGVCFRYEFVIIYDEALFSKHKIHPPLKDVYGENILNKDFEYLLDTDYIERNYTEFVKVPIDNFIDICREWERFLRNNEAYGS